MMYDIVKDVFVIIHRFQDPIVAMIPHVSQKRSRHLQADRTTRPIRISRDPLQDKSLF